MTKTNNKGERVEDKMCWRINLTIDNCTASNTKNLNPDITWQGHSISYERDKDKMMKTLPCFVINYLIYWVLNNY